jgi:tripeptidyl-peptidase-1
MPALNRRERVHPDSIVPIRIGLKQSNLEIGYERLMDVSHPSSKNYGNHLSAAEVHELFAPAEETVQAVKDWLILSGVDASSITDYENRGWLAIDMPAQQAERLLSTEYYEHDSKDGVRIGCDDYFLPAHVSRHVDYIKPGVQMSPPLKKRVVKRDLWPHQGRPSPPHGRPNWLPDWQMPPAAYGLPPELQNCGVNITPVCIQALYHIPKATYSDPADVMGLYETYDAFSQQVRLCWKC